MVVQDAFGSPITDNSECQFSLTPAGTDNAWFGPESERANPIKNVGPSNAEGRCTVQIRSYLVGDYPVTGTFREYTSVVAESSYAHFSNVVPSWQHSWWSVARTDGNTDPDYARADGAD